MEAPAGIAFVEDIQRIRHRNVEALRHFYHDTTYSVPADDIAYLSVFFFAHKAITSLKEKYFSMTS